MGGLLRLMLHLWYTLGKGVIMTKQKRIHVSFAEIDREILEIIAAKDNRSLSEVVRRRVEEWMQIHEDQYWIDESLLVSKKTISHTEFLKNAQIWNRVLRWLLW